MPHTLQSIVDILHDLRRGLGPSKFKQLLPDVASVAVDDSLGNVAEQFANHMALVVLWDGIKGLLDNMAAKGVHRKVKCMAAYGLGDLDDLFRGTMLKAALNEKISEAVDHQSMGLKNDRIDNLVLLIRSAHLELLLEEDGGLLIIVTHNLVDDVFPVAVDITVEKASVVQWFGCR